jgi:hypothetical protein
MQITKEFLKSLYPCIDGYKWWCEKYGESVELSEFVKAADKNWGYVRWLSVRCLTHKSQVMFAVWCAEKVVHLAQHQEITQAAIDAAKKWIEDPSEENRDAADAAADAAAYAAAADAAAYAAATAAYSASAAAYSASAATNAAAAAVYADAADEEFKREAMEYLLTLETIKCK